MEVMHRVGGNPGQTTEQHFAPAVRAAAELWCEILCGAVAGHRVSWERQILPSWWHSSLLGKERGTPWAVWAELSQPTAGQEWLLVCWCDGSHRTKLLVSPEVSLVCGQHWCCDELQAVLYSAQRVSDTQALSVPKGCWFKHLVAWEWGSLVPVRDVSLLGLCLVPGVGLGRCGRTWQV